MVVNVYGATKIGKGFANYDSLFIDRYVASTASMIYGQFAFTQHLNDSEGFLFGVADGVGSLNNSDVISDMVCRSASESASIHGRSVQADMYWHIRDILGRCGADIMSYYDNKQIQLACTFTAAKITDSTIQVSNVGDSPCMLLHGVSYEYLFREDSKSAEHRKVEDRSDSDKGQNYITKCIASWKLPDPDDFYYVEKQFCKSDVVILASDSLTKGLSDREIVDYFKMRRAKKVNGNPALDLAEKAYIKAFDDTTVIVVEFE